MVWSRVDLARGRVISDSHNFRKHEQVARELEREFGFAPVHGVHVERQGRKRPPRTPSHAEMQQSKRTGISPRQARATITALWNATAAGKEFAEAISKAGWTLARGEKVPFILIDPKGGIHSLARRIEGVTAKDIRARMADIDPASLPSVKTARATIRARARSKLRSTGGEGQHQEARAGIVIPFAKQARRLAQPAMQLRRSLQPGRRAKTATRQEHGTAARSFPRLPKSAPFEIARAAIIRRTEGSGRNDRPCGVGAASQREKEQPRADHPRGDSGKASRGFYALAESRADFGRPCIQSGADAGRRSEPHSHGTSARIISALGEFRAVAQWAGKPVTSAIGEGSPQPGRTALHPHRPQSVGLCCEHCRNVFTPQELKRHYARGCPALKAG